MDIIDLRREVVWVFEKEIGRFVDKTQKIAELRGPGSDGRISIRYRNGRQAYPYNADRIRIVPVREVPIPPGAKVSVDGDIWPSVSDVLAFEGPDGPLRRVIYRRAGQEGFTTLPAGQIQVITSAEQNPRADDVLTYWRAIAGRLPADDPTRIAYAKLDFVHPESALGEYLVGAPIRRPEPPAAPIFPFRCNLSQRQAVDNALSNSISVSEGPPGTGKTETILNLIGSIVAAGAGTVGVVSLSNSAVDNVREKLVDLGFGYVIAGLGKKEKRQEFFDAQATRNMEVRSFLQEEHLAPPARRLADVDSRLRAAQAAERTRAELRLELDAHLLELRHFEDHVARQDIPDLEGLPLLRRSSERILDFLAETHFDVTGSRPGLPQRIRRYLRYGKLRGLDPGDTEVVLRLQRAYYDRRITELQAEIERVENTLRRAHFDHLVAEHQQLSGQFLRAALDARYRELPRTSYQESSYRTGKTFQQFTEDYPVVLSTCHSLRSSIAGGTLLDYLIIDEASQVDLLTAGLALSCCRNLIVVGDRKQLAQIDGGTAEGLIAPGPAYDYGQSILSSLGELYGGQLPVTLLREHYRCDPAIIGYCNKAFYDGDLIPYTLTGSGRAMIVAPTVAGNHMRQHRGGGRSNQREVDVIVSEVIPRYCAEFPATDIGVTTPYNLQVDKVAAALLEGSEAATVHKFQGRQRPVVIMTTVLDETRRGRTGHKFVDDPKMINVAVSRAARKFMLVTNNQLMASSRHLRDLIGYIRYHDPDQGVVHSDVISVFDLLYQEYDRRLRPLAARRRQELKYPSEDIIWTVLLGLLAEEKYAHLTAVGQVLLRNLLPDLSGLTPRQAKYVQNRASVDFVVYNRVTNQPWLVIEVDGFKYHENDPEQRARDELKNQILQGRGMPLCRLPTTGSNEEHRIREALDGSEVRWSTAAGARSSALGPPSNLD